MNEAQIVAAIEALLESPRSRRVVLGIGDDAALWQPSRSHRSAMTTDMLVDGVHFSRATMTLADAGWRALAANLSDLAAMGARPVLATVALGVPADGTLEDILDLYGGIAHAARAGRIVIAGGDLSRAPAYTIAIAAVGEVAAARAKLRCGGHAGDVVAVTGALGAARAGLTLARGEAGAVAGNEGAAEALERFRRPTARLAEGRFLAASRNVGAMMDCSDGLSTDLARLCGACGLGARVERVPVAPGAALVADAIGEDAHAFALAGGEDFELLVSVRARAFEHLALRFRARFGRALERVGVLRAQPGIEWNGAPLETSGWDHFAR